jgi:serine/threonine-protein kinase
MVGHEFLGRYEMERPLGEGSMGRVYLAQDLESGRRVAVKVLHEAVAKQPKFRELFEREMELMSKFQHPNVVDVYEASATDPNGLCMVMEYVPGTDLECVLRNGRLSVARTGRILGQLCAALQAAHAEGIIHRDLKPANVMVMEAGTDREWVKVMDFGLAKLADSFYISLDKLKGDAADIATGTAEYMAPEQIRGDALDHRGDLYSVGVMLYEMLTGKLPFDPPTIPELLQAHAEEPVPSFASRGITDVAPAVENVVRWCMEKFPVERPQSAWELAERYASAAGLKILEQKEPLTPSGLLRLSESQRAPKDAGNAAVFQMEAFMQERIATVKLRGYIDDVGGEMVDSVPGMIRVRFGQQGCRYRIRVPARKRGLLGWVGLRRMKYQLIDVELRMRKAEAGPSNQLHITLLIRPAGGDPVPFNPEWKTCCNRIYKDLKGYLMAN